MTCTVDNLLKTVKNLNLVGAFDRSNTTLGTAIPHSIGLYQLFDQCVVELNILKQSVKTNEKKLLVVLSADNADASVDVSGDGVSVASHKSTVGADQTRGGVSGVTSDTPAVHIGVTGHQVTEDGLYSFTAAFAHHLMTLNTDSAATVGAVSATIGA